jgi:hypothetical protein
VNLALSREDWLPDEINAATDTLRAAVRAAVPVKGLCQRYVLFYSSVCAIGAWAGLGLLEASLVVVQSMNFWRSALTLLGVLSGFMITTMLFTGKIEVAKLLTLEQLEKVTEKSNHLLISQFFTLLNHVAATFLIGLITALDDKYAVNLQGLVPAAFGLLFISFFRSVLVPVQIIELHRFVHAALLEDKRREITNAVEEV